MKSNKSVMYSKSKNLVQVNILLSKVMMVIAFISLLRENLLLKRRRMINLPKKFLLIRKATILVKLLWSRILSDRLVSRPSRIVELFPSIDRLLKDCLVQSRIS